jgi:hypothetical protein
VEVLTGKLERANLAKSMADSKLSELDRYKAMIELEMNEILARHKTAMTEKMARAVQVREWGSERGRGRRRGREEGGGREGTKRRAREKSIFNFRHLSLRLRSTSCSPRLN